MSRLYRGLPYDTQKQIAEKFGISINLDSFQREMRREVIRKRPLANWLEQLTVVRNACVRHSRVWN
ncbi:Abi family protein [Boudabousia marimammalium]|uniref:Abi family protein n=1 Tax=Boudabousia marimammalium TaxID=156892 RepID=UPI0009FD2F33